MGCDCAFLDAGGLLWHARHHIHKLRRRDVAYDLGRRSPFPRFERLIDDVRRARVCREDADGRTAVPPGELRDPPSVGHRGGLAGHPGARRWWLPDRVQGAVVELRCAWYSIR
ncbi:hypothetical protein ACFPRL_14165 [Pseudoclavibacter helvolus]